MPRPLAPKTQRPLPPAGQAPPQPIPEGASSAGPKRQENRPVHELKHRSVRATIWKNDTVKGPMYNVTVSRIYRDGEQWKDSQSFGFDDLMNLAKLLFDAHTYISAVRDEQRPQNAPG